MSVIEHIRLTQPVVQRISKCHLSIKSYVVLGKIYYIMYKILLYIQGRLKRKISLLAGRLLSLVSLSAV